MNSQNWWRVLRAFWRTTSERNLDLIAAGIAFYGMLAIFPAVAAVIALWGFVSDPGVIQTQFDLLATFVPEQAMALLEGQIRALVAANDSTLRWTTALSTLAALWMTRAGVGALMRGLNAAYGTRPRDGLMRIGNVILLTLAMIMVALVALAGIVVTPVILAFLPAGGWTAPLLSVSRWVLVIAVVMLGLGLIYRYGPNHKGRRTRWISPGAVFALLVWAVASFGLSAYLTNFGNYNQVYGSIGAVIALLMWFFISAYAILLGAVLNAEIARTRPPGPSPEPRG